jgi:hypothetical protein
MTGSIGADRRILRAFYTQYVAVLLILLVFCIGSVSKETARHDQGSDSGQAVSPLGTVHYPEFFQAMDSAEINYAGGIKAIYEVLRNHEVRAVFTISAPLLPDPREAATSVSLRAAALRTQAAQDSIPFKAIKVVVVPSAKPSAAVSVSFESLEDRDAES